MLEFIIPHKPTPWAAPSRRKGVWYNPRHAIKVRTQSLIRGQYNGPLIDKICTLFFRFYFAPPKSARITQKAKMLANVIVPTKCDLTNLQKFYEDCLKGIVLTDDRIVAKIDSSKWYGPKDYVHITVLDYRPL